MLFMGPILVALRAGYSGEEAFYNPIHSARFCTVEVTLIATFTAKANGCHGRQPSRPAMLANGLKSVFVFECMCSRLPVQAFISL